MPYNTLMLLSIIIPVYNEEKTIKQVLRKISRLKIKNWQFELIIVDDGSSDKSADLIKTEIKNLKNVKFIAHQKNLGKGAAIRTSIPHIKGQVVIIQDADLEYDPKHYTNLLKYHNKKVAVYGSRLKTTNPKAYLATYLGNVLLTQFANLLYQTNLTDSYTCYKLIPTNIFKSLDLQSNSFEIEAEITAKLARKQVKIIEVPITYLPRNYSQGKKIGWVDGIKGIYTYLRYS